MLEPEQVIAVQSGSYSLAGAIVPHDQGERPVELDDPLVVRAEAPDALDQHLVDGAHGCFCGQALEGACVSQPELSSCQGRAAMADALSVPVSCPWRHLPQSRSALLYCRGPESAGIEVLR